MKFKTLDGREVLLNIRQSDFPVRTLEECRSKIQFECGKQIRSIVPRMVILEEFTCLGTQLKLDFFVPTLMVAFEVQGEQHFSYNKFFHDSPQDFKKSLVRDKIKAQWCELNSIELIYLRKKEDVGPAITKFYRET